ncbi:MAG: hypothetical protein JXA77_00935 [Bacteroidales bacterium]|nr:hypothetical protein [Bacteroidales bacterium]MBN2817695.1 hypothetical protein [Bacteroidales bacterium]
MSLDNKLIRKIRRMYGIDILPIGMESYTLGDIVEWNGIIKKPSMENYSFVNYLRLDSDKQTEYKNRLKTVQPVAAQLAKIQLDTSFDFQSGADIPNFATETGLDVSHENITGINVEDIQCKVIERDLKYDLMQELIQIKKNDRRYYRKELKKLFMLDKLFYAGKVNLTIQTNSKAKIEAAVLKSKLVNPKIAEKSEKEVSISFSGDKTIPFAADIEQINDFLNL